MYAIIRDSGRQIKVVEGQELDVDYRDAAKGDEITFNDVVAFSGDDGLRVGKPTVDGVSVTAEVLGVRMGDKLTVQKLRRRKNSRRKAGHRQVYTTVRVAKIIA